MVSIKKKFKKILVIFFIITLLSNYILILNEIGNEVYASSMELIPEFTSDLNQEETSNNVDESNIVNVDNSDILDQNETKSEEVDQEKPKNEEISENQENTNSIENEEVNKNELTQEEIEKLNSISVNTELQINNLIKFDNNNGKGIFAEFTIGFNIDTKGLEIYNMKAEFEVPNVSGILPYTYEIKNLNESVNAIQEGNNIILNINNMENSKNEVRMVCVYSEEAFSETELKYSGQMKIEVLNQEIVKEFESSKLLEESKNNFANYQIVSDTSSKFKGYLYANTMLENKREFPYTTTDVINLNETNFIDEFIIENTVDKVITKNNEEIPLANLSMYKATSISKNEFDKVFGNTGYIEIYNQVGQKIGEIDSNSKLKNNRYYFFYNTEVDRITLKFINFENIGTLNIRNEKAIKGTDVFSKEFVKGISEIKIQTQNKAVKLVNNNEIIISNIYAENKVVLEETETKAELTLSSNSFSSNMNNEVTLNINLKTDSEQYELYKNPYIEVVLPEQFEKVEIKSVNLLYKNGLSLSEWNVEKNAQNENVLKIKLEGIQEEYLPGIIKGTNINVDLLVTLNELTTSNKGIIKLKYTNEGGTFTTYEKQGKEYEQYEIDYVSKTELLKVAYLNNITDNIEIVNNINTDSNIGSIEMNSTSKTLKASIKYINNLKADMNNVEIIGSLPFVGNKDGNNNELGTTINANLKSAIKTSGLVAKIYYSEEANTPSESDLWKENVTDFTNVKCFKIIVENNVIHQGESIEVMYDIVIPENLTYNQLISSDATIYYNFNGEERKDNTIVGVETEENKEINLDEYTLAEVEAENTNNLSEENGLTISTKATAGGKTIKADDEVNERQILKYEAIVKNTSNNTINNIELKGNAINANMYYFYTYEAHSTTTGTTVTTGEWIEDKDGNYKNASTSIPILNPGETAKFEYFVIVNNLTQIGSKEKEVYGQIQIKADGIDTFSIKTMKNNIRKAELELHLSIGDYEDVNQMILETGGDLRLAGYLKNISDTDLKNVSVSFILPEGVEYNRLTEYLHEEYIVTEEKLSVGSMVTVTLSDLNAGEEKIIYILTDLHNFDISIPSKDILMYTKVNLNGQEYLSNDYVRTITQTETQYDIKYTSNKENGSNVQNGEKITYDYTVKNLGSIDGKVTLTDYFPNGLIINSVKLQKEDGSIVDLPLVSTDENALENENFGNEVEEIEYYDIEEEVDGVIEDDQVLYEDAIYEEEKETPGLKGDLSYDLTIKPQETVKLKIDATVNLEDCIGKQEKIENSISVESGEEETISYDIVYPENWFDDIIVEDSLIDGNVVEAQEETEEDISDESEYREVNILEYNDEKIKNDEKLDTYNSLKIFNTVSNKENDNIIDGTVVLEKTENSNSEEKELSNQVVALYDLNSNKEIQRKNTNNKGNYAFYNVPNGNYVVAFYYDNELYDVKPYNSTTSENNISMQETDNKSYAVSNEISVNDSDISNINIGLIDKNEFDLSIDTYISSITVKTAKDSETYEYDEKSLAKVEISPKDVDGAELTAVLKVKVTNVGNIIGYVTQLSNIIPEGWQFSEELNKNWVLTDGILYSSALENTLIQPDTSEEINLIITKTMSGDATGVYKNEAKIYNSSNILEIKDNNTENDVATTEFIVSIKTGVLTYIVYIIIAILVFSIILYIINIKVLKNKNFKMKITINVIITLAVIFTILIVFIIKNISNAGYVNSSGLDYIRHWATGMGASSSQATQTYSRLDDFMNNFYGAGTRTQVLKRDNSFVRNDLQARTEQCLHGTSIGADAALNKAFNTGYYYKIVSIVDFGWNNGAITAFNRMYGNYNNKVFKDSSKINVSNYVTTQDQAQTMSYASYMIDSQGWGVVPATGTGLTFHKAYLAAIPTILRDFTGYNKNLKKVSAIYINNVQTVEHTYKSDVKKAQAAFADFNKSNMTHFGITKEDTTADKIKIKDATGKSTIKINKTYISGIKVKFPIKGRNKFLKNMTRIYISTNSGKTYKQYKGKVYKYSSTTKKYTGYSQDSNYWLNTSKNGFNNKAIYIPKSALGSSYTASKVRIKITNSYYTYASRFLYYYSTSQDQNKGVVRGKRITRSSSVIYRVGTIPGVKISKSVKSIDGSSSNKTYVEKGCQVQFAIKLECTGSGSINNITFTDNPTGFKYISCSSNLSKSGTSFTYSGTISAGSSATVYITYEVTADNDLNSNKVLTNTVEITSVKQPGSSTNIKGTKNIRSDSVYKASTNVKMKTYEIEINKYVYSVSSASGVKDYSDRVNDKSKTVYAEYNDQVIFEIDVKNTGDTGNSSTNGEIRNVQFSDTFNSSELQYINWSLSADTEYNVQTDEDESDEIIDAPEEDADSDNTDESDGSEESGDEETDDDFSGEEGEDGEGEDNDLAVIPGISYKASAGNGVNLTDTVGGTTATVGNGYINFKIDQLKTGDTVKIYVTFKVIRLSGTPYTTTNTSNITYLEQHHNKDITSLTSSSSVKTSRDSVRIKGYRASISKIIQSGTDSANYAETGDIITYKITLSNSGTNPEYGNLKNIRIFDDYNSDELTFISYSANNSNFIEKNAVTGQYANSGNWSKYKDNEGKYYSYYTYNGTIAPGNSVTLYLKFKVKKLSKENITIQNGAQIDSAYNQNGSSVTEVLTKDKAIANFILKIYLLNVEKTIVNVGGVAITNQNDITCELGDIVTYQIKVTNSGYFPNYGKIYSFNLSDIFKTNELEYDSTQTDYGTDWSLDKTTNTFTNSKGIDLGSSSTITLKMKVILRSTTEVTIRNTAKISRKTNIVNNKNSINVVKVLNGKLEDSADMTYLTYNVDVRKYITKYNDSNIIGRIDKTNLQKYDNPVEVEKNETVNYTLRIENTGRTNLYNATIQDILESGIIFSNNNFESARKYASSSDSVGTDVASKVSVTTNGLTRIFNYTDPLNSGEVLVIEFKATIIKTNMYLLNLKNEIAITSIKNKNNFDVVAEGILNLDRNDNYEYVRLKNLIISGQVWLDKNEDGLMNDNVNLSGIKVILHDDTNKKITETYTDSNGKYVFSETNGVGSGSNKKMVEGGVNSGRVIKATNRNDTTGNYDTTSQYINYYVEFYYNGVRYENTIYSGRNNLNPTDNAMKDNYTIDSNALEYSDLREELRNNFETIEYNKAIRGVEDIGSNIRTISYEKKNHESLLRLTPETAISAYSFVKTTNTKYGSGITNGNNIDMLFLSQSGETEYLKYINLGLRARDLDLSITNDVYSLKTTINGSQMIYTFAQGNNAPYGGAYVTGGTSNPINYTFNLYASDYYYNRMNYENAEVQEYKKNTELNTEITYKMTVKNNDVGDTGKVYAKIREIVDYYSTDFISYNSSGNTKKIKLMDDKGYLQEADLVKVEAWYEYKSNKGTVKMSNTSRYPEHAKVNLLGKYNKIYLTGFDNLDLKQGDSFNIFIKFTVNTEDGTEKTKLKLGDKNNIVEINAYSTYLETNNKPAGYVDKNSNPGNLGVQTDSASIIGTENASIENYNDYENDTYKTGITLTVQNTPTPADPPTPETPPGTPEGKLERVLTGTVWDDARSEAIWDKSKESKIENAKDIQYIGNGLMNVVGSKVDKKFRKVLNKRDDNGDKIILEPQTNKKKIGNTLIHDESTDIYAEDISVNLVEIIKIPNGTGEKIYEETGENIATWSNAIVSTRSKQNGLYKLESFIPGNYIIRFKYGENEADVAYNGQEYKSTAYYTDIDKEVGETKASADKVLSKLEEVGKNDARDDEIRRLEVIAYSEIVNNSKTQEAQKSKPSDYSKEFMQNTYMNAETVTFPVRSEKVTYDVTTLNFEQTNNKIFKIQNIDFGLEYRPEVSVAIQEYLSEVKLTTSSGNILVDIKFDNQYENDDPTRRIIGTTPNATESTGLQNLQYLPSREDVKGLAYLNVDADLLQGCTIEVTYVFNVDNNSENDRISKKLYDLKYKVDAGNLGFSEFFNNTQDNIYTAAETARNELYNDFYETPIYRNKDKKPYDGINGYYGKYLGETYYTGTIGNDDVLSELKVDKILDYVDNDMTMSLDKNSTENKYWTTTTDDELRNGGLIAEHLFNKVDMTSRVNGELIQVPVFKLVDTKGISYHSDQKHNLAVSVDDKISSDDQNNMNKLLSKFLTTYLFNPSTSSGKVYMTTLKVLASESDTEDMTYDNSAEIIQYTSSTGRIAGLSATVGNLNMADNRDLTKTPSKKPNYEEDDETTTERVTLTPPTGLEKSRYYISVFKDEFIKIVALIFIIIIVVIVKKKIKKVHLKKFYK